MSQRMEKLRKSEIKDKLRNWFSDAQRVVIAGIGNPLRRDDSIGIEIVRSLRSRVSQAVFLIECETVPENYMEEINELRPTHILIIDAAHMDLKPGSSELVDPDQMAGHLISTHALPLQIFCEYLAMTTKAKIALLLIQPRNTSFGEGLTPEVEESAEQLTDSLSGMIYQALAGNRAAKPKKAGQAFYTSRRRR